MAFLAGGSFGVFTGFSLMSLVEGLYWIYLSAAKVFERTKVYRKMSFV